MDCFNENKHFVLDCSESMERERQALRNYMHNPSIFIITVCHGALQLVGDQIKKRIPCLTCGMYWRINGIARFLHHLPTFCTAGTEIFPTNGVNFAQNIIMWN
jgi:hypothetical protein